MAAFLPWWRNTKFVLCHVSSRNIRLPPSLPRIPLVGSNEVLVGVDEAGRGSLAGPVVAAAVAMMGDFDVTTLNEGVVDSKKLTSKQQREHVYQQLMEAAGLKWAVAYRDEAHIDNVNILQATFDAMTQAVQNLSVDHAAQVLVDGNSVPPKLKTSFDCKSVVNGDSKQFVIAAASIIAKVTRDRYMCKLDKEYPGYGFANHNGYATKKHYLALKQNGCSEAHRKTFEPVKSFLVGGCWPEWGKR